VAHVYKALWTVEDIIRTSKSIFETRPIYHKRDETIRGHVFCSFLALLLKQELENRMNEPICNGNGKKSFAGWMLCSNSKPISRADAFYSLSLRPTLRKRCVLPAWRYHLHCGNSSEEGRARNVVPRDFDIT
jgi:hypothetical protein